MPQTSASPLWSSAGEMQAGHRDTEELELSVGGLRIASVSREAPALEHQEHACAGLDVSVSSVGFGPHRGATARPWRFCFNLGMSSQAAAGQAQPTVPDTSDDWSCGHSRPRGCDRFVLWFRLDFPDSQSHRVSVHPGPLGKFGFKSFAL